MMRLRMTAAVFGLLLLGAGPAAGQYSGTYTIMPSGGDFASHVEAADSLMTYGVVGPCTLLMHTGRYFGRAYFCDAAWDSVEVVFLAASGENPVVEASDYPWHFVRTRRLKVDGVRMVGNNGAQVSSSHHTKFYNCDIDAGYRGLSLDRSDTCRVVGCVIRSGDEGIRWERSDCRHIEGNDIRTSNSHGLYMWDVSQQNHNDTVVNNMVYSGSGYGAYTSYGNHALWAYNTVWSNTDCGLYCYQDSNSRYYNNIFTTAADTCIMYINGGSIDSADYNCWYNAYGHMTYPYSWSLWQAAGYDPHGMYQDPKVGGPLNLHLTADSPCIDSGMAMARFPLDIDGDTIHNGVRDIGADEYTGAGLGMAGRFLVHLDPDSGDYSSLTEACADLALRGTAAACTFDIAAGAYHGQVLIGDVSSGHPVVFQARGYGTLGKEDVTIEHSSSPVELNGSERVVIQGFDIVTSTTTSAYGVRLYYSGTDGCDWCVIRDNNISAAQGIYMSNYTDHCSVVGNRFRGSGYYGICCKGNSADPNTGNVFINNMFASNSRGVSLSCHDSTRLLFNSFRGLHYGFYDDNGRQETMHNNIFYGRLRHGWHKEQGDVLPAASDHNCFYGRHDPEVIYHSTHGALTLAEWRSHSGMDNNSIARNPLFAGEPDLHLRTQSPCRDSALSLPAIAVDIDGDTRDSDPDIGADEWRSPGPPMNGTYFVHPDPDSGDFDSYIEGVGQLALRGFDGDVTLSGYTGTYPGSVDLQEIGSGPYSLTLNAVQGETPVLTDTTLEGFAIRMVANRNIRIEGLTINGYYGIYMYNADEQGCEDCEIIGNTINGGYIGIYLYDYSRHNTLAGNVITSSGYYGIYAAGDNRPVGNRFYNNFVRMFRNGGRGAQLLTQDSVQFLYNSLYGTFEYGLSVSACSYGTFRNTIAYTRLGPPDSAPPAVVYTACPFLESDYNCWWNLDTANPRRVINFMTLPQWQAQTGLDLHSIDRDPCFVSVADLHLQDSSPCIDIGIPVPGILTDIDGELRDSLPDVGADEVVITGVAVPGKPRTVALFRAAPNPAFGPVRIRWQVPGLCQVSLRVHDITGRCVGKLVDGMTAAGVYETVWSGRDESGRRLAAGVYFYTLETGDKRLTHKVVLSSVR